MLQLGARAAAERRPGGAAVDRRVLVQRRERARRLSLRLSVPALGRAARGLGVLAIRGVRLGPCRAQTPSSWQPLLMAAELVAAASCL